MQFSTMEIVSIIGLIVTLCSFGGMVVYGILKGKFITPEQCKEAQGTCRMYTCQKIEGVKLQVVGMANEFKESRENSERKRDAARSEYAGKIEKIYKLIQETEEHRAAQLEKMHTFMGRVEADLKTLKERVT